MAEVTILNAYGSRVGIFLEKSGLDTVKGLIPDTIGGRPMLQVNEQQLQ